MSVLERVRASGKFPPSLLRDATGQDDFEAALLKVLDTNNGTYFVRFIGVQIARNSLSIFLRNFNTISKSYSIVERDGEFAVIGVLTTLFITIIAHIIMAPVVFSFRALAFLGTFRRR